jgi:hypothetical protein
MRVEAHEGKARHEFALEAGGAKPVTAAIRFGDSIPADQFHETNQIGPDGIEPTGLVLRRREAPSRRMDTGTTSPVAVLRDARKSALLRTRLIDDINMNRTSETNDQVFSKTLSS